MKVIIYHNPRCTKSRQTLQLLQDQGIEPEVIEYLNTPPDRKTLSRIIAMLGISPRDLMRRKEAPWKALGLDDPSISDDRLIDVMVEYPILIERPIVIAGKQAALGRPPEKVLEIL